MVKNRFLPLYQQSALPTHVVRYEEFARNPETSIREVCDFLKLEWHKNLTEHYKFSSGLWGGTDKGAPIHQRSVAAYRGSLTLDQRKSLYSAIGGAMKALGYQELLDA